ncbi:MAG: hypothetical protein F6K65_05825 [Moorea sp. SIO3C2]|nr:hypothetical protein [Moorena sp. SIO3C2]
MGGTPKTTLHHFGLIFVHCSLFPVPCSLFPVPDCEKATKVVIVQMFLFS